MWLLMSRSWTASVSALALLMCSAPFSVPWACGQSEEIRKALSIRPNQPGVDYDIVAEADMERCTLVRAAEVFGIPGWIVRDSTGRTLRQYLDLNRDGQLDQWSFFKNGIEVYRDIDSNYDRKADQYRWLGTAGIRWGIDRDQDGIIDTWQMISAEEVVAEVFAAVQQRDRRRFLRLLATPDEVAALQLGDAWHRAVTASLQQAAAEFDAFASEQSAITKESQFVHFGSSRPCLVPAGANGNQLDLIFHDHAAAVFQTGDRFDQLAIGTLVKIGDAYRLLEKPASVVAGTPLANGGLFFQFGDDASLAAGMRAPGTSSERVYEMFAEIEELNKQLAGKLPPAQAATVHQRRADRYFEIIKASAPGEDRENWIRSAADALVTAYQDGSFAGGWDALKNLQAQVDALTGQAGGDYVAWRMLLARFAKGMEDPTSDRSSIADQYIHDLEAFVTKYPQSEFSPEALLNLAMYAEVSERSDPNVAKRWYVQLARDFSDQPAGRRAQGAQMRLASTGKPLVLQGKTLDGQDFNLRAHAGKVVVVHFWATWCDACIEEFAEFQRLAAKYQRDLVVVGVNLDDSPDETRRYLQQNRQVSWPQLFEPGGLEESPLAEKWGIPTLPWIVLIDPQGNVVNTNAAALELDREIQRLLDEK